MSTTTLDSRACLLAQRTPQKRRGSSNAHLKRSIERAGEITELTTAQAAYLAGFIDGEGCISFTCRRAAKKSMVSITVANTHAEVIQRLKLLTNAGSLTFNDRKGQPNERPVYIWNCYGNAAKRIAEQILPYLIVKRRHAELIIEIQERLNLGGSCDWAEPYLTMFRSLNRRGIRGD